MSSSQPPRIPTLKQLLIEKGVSKIALGDSIDIHPDTLRKWQRGSSLPRIDHVLAVSRILDVSLKTFCSSIGLDTDGIPDDSPETRQLASDDQQERQRQAEEIHALEEMIEETSSIIEQLRERQIKLKKRVSDRKKNSSQTG